MNDRNLKPFKRGDARINRNGRPKNFDALRTLAQAIAHEVVCKDGAPVTVDGHTLTVVETILRQWAQSKVPRLQMAFIEIAYGKVPDRVEVGGKASDDIQIVVVEPGVIDYRRNLAAIAPGDDD